MANNVECVRCGQLFDLDAGGIAYQGREGIVTMCEPHVPDQFQEGATDAELAEEMGVGLRNAWGEEDGDEGNYESDEYGPGGVYEDPYAAYERERGEAFQDRLDMWRREY